MEYVYVKLNKDVSEIIKKCDEASERINEARNLARAKAVAEIGCDELLYGRHNMLYVGFKEKPSSSDPWWRKNSVTSAGGYWVLEPKVRSSQGVALKDIRASYKKDIGEEVSLSAIITKDYPEIKRDVLMGGSGQGMCIANPVFAVAGKEKRIVIGRLPMDSNGDVVIPDDFTEITTTEFRSYLEG